MPVDILIGSEHYWTVVTGEVVCEETGPIAIGTHLGWVLSGPTCNADKGASAVNVITTHTLRIDSRNVKADEGMDLTLQQFWDLEYLGISSDEMSILENFDETIAFKNGHYKVSLPWKEAHPYLSDNYEFSKKRLLGLLYHLRQRPTMLQGYDATIKDQLNQGIMEKIDEPDQPVSGVTHYIPHLKVVPDLTAQSFIRCFKRFSARRGFPTKLLSDNGTTFRAASKMLQNIVKHPGVEQSLS